MGDSGKRGSCDPVGSRQACSNAANLSCLGFLGSFFFVVLVVKVVRGWMYVEGEEGEDVRDGVSVQLVPQRATTR